MNSFTVLDPKRGAKYLRPIRATRGLNEVRKHSTTTLKPLNPCICHFMKQSEFYINFEKHLTQKSFCFKLKSPNFAKFKILQQNLDYRKSSCSFTKKKCNFVTNLLFYIKKSQFCEISVFYVKNVLFPLKYCETSQIPGFVGNIFDFRTENYSLRNFQSTFQIIAILQKLTIDLKITMLG